MYETIKRPALPQDDPRLFKIKTGIVKAIKEAGENGAPDRYFLEGIASSTVVDRHGDTITESAQSQMLAAARDLTMWLNHSYNVPEDILGVCRQSNLQAAVDNGEDCLDLVIRLEVYPDNPRAMKSWNAVQWGAQLGFSIGGAVTDFEWVDEDDWWSALIINGLDLYEISLVGIPANPRAYTKFVEDIAGKMRSAAVERAKDIVGKATSKDAAQVLLKKSLIGEQGETMEPKTAKDLVEQVADDLQVLDKVEAESDEDACVQVNDGDTVECGLPKDNVIHRESGGHEFIAKSDENTRNDERVLSLEAGKYTLKGGVLYLFTEDEWSEVAKDSAGDDAFPNEDACANIVRCLKSMKASMAHGMCAESLSSVESAHALLKSLLPQDYPYEDDPTADPADPDDIQYSIKLNLDTTEARQKIAELTETLTAKAAELETLSSNATQRAAEVTEAEKRIETLKAEEIELQQKIDALKATPTGRHTAQAGGSHSGAAYTMRAQTIDQARKRLGAALTGSHVDDPERRT